MKKPVLKDYGITEKDLYSSEIIKKRLIIVSIIFMFICLGLFVYDQNNKFFMWVFLIFGVPPYGAIFLYFISKRILRLFSHSIQASEKYLSDYKTFKEWWIRMQEVFWKSLSGRQFENELANLYIKIGYKAEVTTASDDKGVDIWLTKNGQRIPVQCKAHQKSVGPSVVRELYGSMNHFNSDKAILASLSGFTKGVFDYIVDKPIELVDLRWIIKQQSKFEKYD